MVRIEPVGRAAFNVGYAERSEENRQSSEEAERARKAKDDQAGAGTVIATGRVSWFKLDKKFGFVELDGGHGDAFLHMSVLKAAGYVTIPAGTAMRVRIEQQQGRRRVVEVLDIDTDTALPGEPAALRRKNPS